MYFEVNDKNTLSNFPINNRAKLKVKSVNNFLQETHNIIYLFINKCDKYAIKITSK